MTSTPETPAAPGRRPVLAFERALERVCEALPREGTLGVLVVDAKPLEAIERDYGADTHRRSIEDLSSLVREACQGQLREHDAIATSLAGVDAVIVFMLRSRRDDRFYREELPALARAIDASIASHANRLVYPYRRASRFLPVGYALTIHNPTLRPERQVHTAIGWARKQARIDADVAARARREQFLHIVLAEDITSLYEPIVNLTTREVLGYEALARGPAESDVQTPSALFEMAYETDLLFEVDCLCRRAALRGARGMPPGKKLFLNCLPTAIHDPSFSGETLKQTLAELRLRPSDLVFEVSEKVSIDNFAIFREARDHYARMGFNVALDDTGVGYSSLETVMELAPDFMKVDLSLVRSIDTDPPRQELLRALQAVSEKIDAQIIAEGIESREELITLRDIGIPYGQGYLLGRAAPLRRDV
ncbi:MAG: EAL domain-containing protein [Deltaproteobacteria bacterium]|nr:MAG: EAL domain-containing protein [Deltaproteobacteria bacterium]